MEKTLSLVVTIVEGGEYVRDFLRSLQGLENPPPMDVVVPYDASIADVASFAAEFPAVRFQIKFGQHLPNFEEERSFPDSLPEPLTLG